MGSLGQRRRDNKAVHNLYKENKRREDKARQTKGIFLGMVDGWYNPRKKKKSNNSNAWHCCTLLRKVKRKNLMLATR
jgi:hypothetical protein